MLLAVKDLILEQVPIFVILNLIELWLIAMVHNGFLINCMTMGQALDCRKSFPCNFHS